jgi:F0F1-type ATP synthase membrane subunit a|tara:strand:- start:76 stop:369 length:294 start_codon:yes stop_codon:yes gene_type:complete
MKLDFHHKLVSYLTENGWLDHWTAVHMVAGAIICKVALWFGCSALWAVLWVVIIGVAWEVLEYFVEGVEPYGSEEKWINNTASDLIVEVGLAIWMVI